jgi:hypothetical protein
VWLLLLFIVNHHHSRTGRIWYGPVAKQEQVNLHVYDAYRIIRQEKRQ